MVKGGRILQVGFSYVLHGGLSDRHSIADEEIDWGCNFSEHKIVVLSENEIVNFHEHAIGLKTVILGGLIWPKAEKFQSVLENKLFIIIIVQIMFLKFRILIVIFLWK